VTESSMSRKSRAIPRAEGREGTPGRNSTDFNLFQPISIYFNLFQTKKITPHFYDDHPSAHRTLSWTRILQPGTRADPEVSPSRAVESLFSYSATSQDLFALRKPML
jgi:hypothetical protein